MYDAVTSLRLSSLLTKDFAEYVFQARALALSASKPADEVHRWSDTGRLLYRRRVSLTATPRSAITIMTIQSSMLRVFPTFNEKESGVLPEKIGVICRRENT